MCLAPPSLRIDYDSQQYRAFVNQRSSFVPKYLNVFSRALADLQQRHGMPADEPLIWSSPTSKGHYDEKPRPHFDQQHTTDDEPMVARRMEIRTRRLRDSRNHHSATWHPGNAPHRSRARVLTQISQAIEN